MKQLRLIGIDEWGRPVYMDETKKLWKDVNLGNGVPYLHNVAGNDFEGEPNCPIAEEYEIILTLEDFKQNNPCDTCNNAGWETMSKVAACNCCENYEFYDPIHKEDDNEADEQQ